MCCSTNDYILASKPGCCSTNDYSLANVYPVTLVSPEEGLETTSTGGLPGATVSSAEGNEFGKS